jgi:hypothetical protein
MTPSSTEGFFISGNYYGLTGKFPDGSNSEKKFLEKFGGNYGMCYLCPLIIKLLIMLFIKVYLTVMILTSVLFGGSWFLFNIDEKREDLWFKVSMTSGIVLGLMVVGLGLYLIWF